MADAPAPPLVDVKIAVSAVSAATKCTKCGKIFVHSPNASTHVASDKCSGATLKKIKVGMLELPDEYEATRAAVPPPPVVVRVPAANVTGHSGGGTHIGTQNNAPAAHTQNNTSIHTLNQYIIVTGDELGDLVKAGSIAESELIRKTILENAELQRSVLTVENAPSAIFRATKGAAGPPCLRNTRKDRHRVQEHTESGVRETTLLDYCKRTAVELVDELKGVVASVGPNAPPHIQEWARTVNDELHKKVAGDIDYVRALALYRDASRTFYSLPNKDAIASDVRMIGSYIPDDARF